MSSDQTITNVFRGSQHKGRSPRQSNAQFPQKLYQIVNDPENRHLIRWSDAGDSFFILNPEALARDILGRWFKHEKFESLVRQLNLYGFYKIPHLQQGALRHEAEFSNYAHTHFHRDKPETLCHIQRHKSGSQEDVPAQNIEQDASIDTSAGSPSTEQSDILSGIAAIKRQQTAINANIQLLKSSNQHLWREAMLSRDKYTNQQNTIDRILEFLAGVFRVPGSATTGNPNPVHAFVRPHKFIRGGVDGGEKKAHVSQKIYTAARRESPTRMPSAPSEAVPLPFPESPSLWHGANVPSTPEHSGVNPAEISGLPFDNHGVDLNSFRPPDLSLWNASISRPVTPSRNQPNFDPALQAAFTQILRSPKLMEGILASLPPQSYEALGLHDPSRSSSQVIPYNSQSNYSDPGQANHGPSSPPQLTQDPTPLLDVFRSHLHGTATCASDMDNRLHALEGRVDATMANPVSESSINEISSQTYGAHNPMAHDTAFPMASAQINGELPDQDCNIDMLMERFTNYDDCYTMDASTSESTTRTCPPNSFLDSSASFRSVVPPITGYDNYGSQPETGHKRKPDVANLEEQEWTTGSVTSRVRLE